MAGNPQRRTMVLFVVLAVYIVLQFVWWGVLLLRRDAEITRLTTELIALSGQPLEGMATSRGFRMVVGEGSVFLLLLLVVLVLTFRAIRRDLRSARSQQNFLMAVTHELRTPIAAIKLQLQTLGRDRISEDQRASLREQALAEADRLAVLTDKVLLATRADEGSLALQPISMDVMEALRNIVRRASQRSAGSHHMVLNGPGELVVSMDADALQSIVDNLIENAAKYAPRGTTITIDVQQGREGWRLSVSDEGPGIPAGEEQLIFGKFHRSGNEETRLTKGTGLGLYIVSRLVKSLGGNIQVRARLPKGAIFAASFPTH